MKIRRLRFSWVPEHPRVFAQRHGFVHKVRQRGIKPQACLAEFFQVVSLAKWLVVIREEGLKGFLDRLLTMKYHILQEWRLSLQTDMGSAEIAGGLLEPACSVSK